MPLRVCFPKAPDFHRGALNQLGTIGRLKSRGQTRHHFKGEQHMLAAPAGRHGQIGRQRQRCVAVAANAAVIGHHLLVGGVVIHHEGAASDGAGLRLDQAQYGLHGHGSIHRRATGLEHIAPGLGGQRGVGHHHVVAGLLGLVAQAVARSGFGRSGVARQAGTHHHRRAGARDDRTALRVVVHHQIGI